MTRYSRTLTFHSEAVAVAVTWLDLGTRLMTRVCVEYINLCGNRPNVFFAGERQFIFARIRVDSAIGIALYFNTAYVIEVAEVYIKVLVRRNLVCAPGPVVIYDGVTWRVIRFS